MKRVRGNRASPPVVAALVLLALLSASSAAAQQYFGGIAGVVVDSAGRGIPLVEVIIGGTAARQLTDSTGRFRFGQLPVGNQRIVLRAIGYDPRQLLALVEANLVTDLGPVLLARRVQELPSLEVTGVLPKPAFKAGTSLLLAEPGTASRYVPSGASMSDEGIYLIQGTWPGVLPGKAGPKGSTLYIMHFDSPNAENGGGSACRAEGVGGVAATRLRGDEISLLTREGVVWTAAALVNRLGRCERFVSFPFSSPLTEATAVDSGWVVLLDGATETQLAEIDEVGRPRWLKRLAEVLPVTTRSQTPPILTPSRSGVIVAQRSAPFEWVELSHLGTVLLRGSPHRGTSLGDSLRVRTGPGWKAFGVVPIANGYLQSLETDRKDTGWHLVYDLLGRPTRLEPRGSIAVVVASLPERRRVFGYGYQRGRLVVQMY